MLIRKVVLSAGIFFAALLLFIPTSSGEIRNLPLLLLTTFLIAATFIFRMLKRFSLLVKIKNAAKSMGAQNIQCRYFRLPFNRFGKYDVIFKLGKKRYNIVVLMVFDKRTRYYFRDENIIERYVAMLMFSMGKVRGNYSRRPQWNEKGKIILPWHNLSDDDINILAFSQFPTEVADSNSRTATLGNGDIIFSKIHLCDIKNFIPCLQNIKKSDRS